MQVKYLQLHEASQRCGQSWKEIEKTSRPRGLDRDLTEHTVVSKEKDCAHLHRFGQGMEAKKMVNRGFGLGKGQRVMPQLCCGFSPCFLLRK